MGQQRPNDGLGAVAKAAVWVTAVVYTKLASSGVRILSIFQAAHKNSAAHLFLCNIMHQKLVFNVHSFGAAGLAIYQHSCCEGLHYGAALAGAYSSNNSISWYDCAGWCPLILHQKDSDSRMGVKLVAEGPEHD